MSCLIYRNVSGKEVSRVLTRCQQDQILPLLSTLLGFGIARYLYLGQIGRTLTGVSGDCIILEDAFRKERFVPLSTCEDFSILKAFLDVHYRGTTAEVFIKTGRFNMMLGSRRGLVIRDTDWSSQGRIKPRQRVVTAVYLETDVKKCIHCTSELTLTGRGEFFCMSCQRYFRDCDAFTYFSRPVSPPVDQPQSAACLLMARTPTTQNLLARIEEMEDDDDAVDLDGLQNVDLRLKQRRKQDDTYAKLAENRELGAPSNPGPVPLIDQAERAEKIRSALKFFSGPCAQDLQTINKVRLELLSLSCLLREINELIELETGSGLAIIEGDLKHVYEDATWTLADIWYCLRRIGRGLTVKDYQKTWKQITETSPKIGERPRQVDRGVQAVLRIVERDARGVRRLTSTGARDAPANSNVPRPLG